MTIEELKRIKDFKHMSGNLYYNIKIEKNNRISFNDAQNKYSNYEISDVIKYFKDKIWIPVEYYNDPIYELW